MQRSGMASVMFAVALVASSVFLGVTASSVTPLQKVTELLEGLAAKGAAEKHAEEVEFSKKHEWCTALRNEKVKSIAEGKMSIQQLEADIDKADADARQLAADIADLASKIAAGEQEKKASIAVHEKATADYEAAHKDYSDSIDAVERAISVLNSRPKEIPESLAQLKESTVVPEDAKAVIESFLSIEQPDNSNEEAYAYENHSNGIIGLLEKLHAKFKGRRLDLEKAEITRKSSHEMVVQKITDDNVHYTGTTHDKTATKAQRMADSADATGDRDSAKTTLAEDEKILDDTNAECNTYSEQFEKNQVTRYEEIMAIKKAIEILSSDAVKGNAEEHLPAAASSFAQLRSTKNRGIAETAVRNRAVTYLQQQASALGSRYLSVIATHVSEDPFRKVKDMIHDLLVKLQEEANAEADKHAYCTSEMAMNKQTREDKSSEVDSLTAQSEELTSKIADLTSKITDLSDGMKELRASQASATAERGESKAENEKAIADARVAQEAVERARKVLQTFYEGAAGTEFTQTSLDPYGGNQASAGGILNILEVVLSDFARLETETTASEDEQARAHSQFMDESNEDLAVKETASEHNSGRRAASQDTLRTTTKDLEFTSNELSSAQNYYDKLKAQCVDKKLSYADRKAAREAEIASLKEALNILDQQALD